VSVQDRWRLHRLQAFKENRKHPLYSAIRKYGAEAFLIDVIDTAKGKKEAQQKEMLHIALAPKEKLYNLSPGGEADGERGRLLFWERLRKDPKALQAYRKKLSDTKKACDWSDYEHLSRLSAAWRKAHPREAWKASYRALRIAARNRELKGPEALPLKERLIRKHKIGEKRRRDVTRIWAERSPEEIEIIGQKISASQKERMKTLAVLPDFKPEAWPYAKATVLRKIKRGMNREQIIQDALDNVKNRGSHWREVEQNLTRMGLL